MKKTILLLALLCLVSTLPVNKLKAQTGIITTVAGGNIYANNNVAATATELFSPVDMIQDASGNIYMAMGNGQCVAKINTSGIISVVAGRYSSSGYSGNGGQATAAQMYSVVSVALDASGNLYIDDENNQVIRKVNTSGVISVYAGTGTMGSSGNGGQATSAQLCNPGSITMDASGNLYIAENCNFDIRKVNTSGVITNYAGIAGYRNSGFSGDGGQATNAEIGFIECMRFNSAGDMFIADYYNGEVRKINHTTGVITDYAGVGTYSTPAGFSGDGGQATAAHFTECQYIAFDASNNLYISDIGNQNIRKVNTSGVISTVAGIPAKQPAFGYSGDGGTATAARLYNPYGMIVTSSGNLLILDQQNFCIRQVNTSNIISTLYGASYGDGNVASNAFLSLTGKAVKDAAGNVYITDYGSSRVRKINTSGIISTIAGIGASPNYGLGYSGDGGQATNAELNNPFSEAVDAAGNVYISDFGNNRIRKINTSGVISTVAGTSVGGYSGNGGQATNAELLNPTDVVVDASGNLYISDLNSVVRKVNTSGIISLYAGNTTQGYSGNGGQATNAELNQPYGLGLDASNNLYIADAGNNVIRKVTTGGVISNVAGNTAAGYTGNGGSAVSAEINDPNGVCIDASNNMYIADFNNNVVREVNTSGIISTIAGITTAGYSGDGGQATIAEMNGPDDVFVDTHNNIYIGDYNNSTIRRVQGPCTVDDRAPTLTTGILCNGATGTATASTATGGTAPYDYKWNSGSTSTNTVNSTLTAGTYTVFVTDAGGCSATSSGLTITQPTAITEGTPTINNHVDCNGNSNGKATAATPSGGTSPYTYQWNSGATSTNAANAALSAGTYSVHVTDAHGCTATSGAITITQPASALAEGSPTHTGDVTCNGSSNGSATAATPTGGTSPYTYQWNSGTTSTNAANAALSAATYTVHITDAHGCTANSSGTVTITQPAVALADGTPTHNSDVICNGGTGSATAATPTGGTSPYTYQWNAGTTSTNAANAALSAATYTVHITDAHGCTANSSGTVTITQPAAALADGTPTLNSNVLCHGGTGSASAAAPTGGTAPYTYAWNGGTTSTNATNAALTANTYTVNITDAHGCTVNSSGSVTITQPTANLAEGTPTVNSNVLCSGGNGSATAAPPTGGTSPYTYAWNGGTTSTNATNAALSAGTYTVNVTDAHGCTTNSSGTVTITQPVATLADGTPTVNSNVACKGNSNGSATAATPTGGTSPYTYKWNAGATSTNPTNSALIAATYTVFVTDAHGCTATSGTVTITEPAATFGVAKGFVNLLCHGGSSGQASATPFGGTSPYTYAWTPNGATTATVSNLSAGSYTLNATDNHGCSASFTVTLTEPPLLGITIASNTNVSCNGSNTGSATANAATGGTPAYNYAWTPSGGNALAASNLAANTYTITATDNDGCTATASVVITQPASALGITMSTHTNINCNGNNTGSATANAATGGTTPYTYAWTPSGGNALTASNLTANTYTITATDNNGCTASATATITQPASLADGTPIVNNNVLCFGGSGSATAALPSGGTLPYTYQWNGGSSSTSATNATLTAGTYTVNVTDAHGCTVSSSGTVTITSPASLPGITIASSTDASSCTGGTATANAATGGTSPYSYQWTPSGGTNLNANNLSGGIYTITATDANNCTAIVSVTISQPASSLSISIASQTDVLCNGGAGTATANAATGGTSPYTYLWSDGNSQTSLIATGLSAGTYSITVYDANNCTNAVGVTITEPAVLGITMASNSADCNGGIANANPATGGTSPYNYVWSDGNSQTSLTATGLSAGSYTVVVTDFNSCTSNATVTITLPDAIATTASSTNISCNNANDGSATANPAGGITPYNYTWSDGSTNTYPNSVSINNLATGNYTVTVTDACSNAASASVTITQPVVLIPNASVTTNITCNGGSDGSASASPAGGTSPYTYLWSDANTTTMASVSNLTYGSYTVTVWDANNCSATASVTITQPVRFIYIIAGTISNVTCNGANNGSATVTPVGGNIPYTYSWSNGSSTVSTLQLPNTLSGGTYTVTVLDNCGASHTASVTITEPNPMNDTIATQINITCGGGNGGSATIGARGGNYPYNYLWSNGATIATASSLSAGTYSVVITDQHGCTNTVNPITITQPVPIRDSVSSVTYPVCNGSRGSATVGVAGGTSPYTYSWAPAVSVTNTANNIAAGSYTVTIKDAHRCAAVLVVTMTQPIAIHDTIVRSLTVNEACKNGSTASATIGVKYGTPPYNYNWSPNVSSTATANGISAGTYLVVITDSNGCSSSIASVTITQPANFLHDSAAFQINVGCYGGNGGQVSLGSRGGLAPYTYLWSDGKTTYLVTGLGAGTYSVVMTDQLGCSLSTSGITITQPASAVVANIPTPTCTTGGHGTITVSGSGGTPGYAFLWSNGNTTTSISVANGAYSVKISDSHGCNSTSSVTMACPDALHGNGGGDAPEQQPTCCATMENINLYPNPNNGQFTVSITNYEVGITNNVEIYNMLGQKVYSQSNIHTPTFNINISSQPNGIYLIRILDKDGNLVSQKKVVKTN